jgi:cytochrome c oxidase assembly factor CtaG
MRMLQSSSEFAKARFWRCVQTLVAIATFLLAAVITNVRRDDSWPRIHLFFFVSGILAFLVVFALNKGKNAKQLAGIFALLAFALTVMFLGLAAFFLGIPALILVRILFGKEFSQTNQEGATQIRTELATALKDSFSRL